MEAVKKDPKKGTKQDKGVLNYNPSREKLRALEILKKAKELERKQIKSGAHWENTFKGRKLVKH